MPAGAFCFSMMYSSILMLPAPRRFWRCFSLIESAKRSFPPRTADLGKLPSGKTGWEFEKRYHSTDSPHDCADSRNGLVPFEEGPHQALFVEGGKVRMLASAKSGG